MGLGCICGVPFVSYCGLRPSKPRVAMVGRSFINVAGFETILLRRVRSEHLGDHTLRSSRRDRRLRRGEGARREVANEKNPLTKLGVFVRGRQGQSAYSSPTRRRIVTDQAFSGKPWGYPRRRRLLFHTRRHGGSKKARHSTEDPGVAKILAILWC